MFQTLDFFLNSLKSIHVKFSLTVLIFIYASLVSTVVIWVRYNVSATQVYIAFFLNIFFSVTGEVEESSR